MTTPSLRAAPALSQYIIPLDEATLPELAGGKANNLYRVLKLGLRVPDGFVVTTHAFETYLDENDLAERIHALSQQRLATRIYDLIVNTPLSTELRDWLNSAAAVLLDRGPVVVRSSAIGEDSAR